MKRLACLLVWMLAFAAPALCAQGGNVYDPTGNTLLNGSGGATFTKTGSGYQISMGVPDKGGTSHAVPIEQATVLGLLCSWRRINCWQGVREIH